MGVSNGARLGKVGDNMNLALHLIIPLLSALFMILCGIVFLLWHGPYILRQWIKAGRCSEEEGKSRMKIMRICGYAMIAGGILMFLGFLGTYLSPHC